MRLLRAFGAFWYEFIVGDDWTVAVAVVIAVSVTFMVGHYGPAPAWAVTILGVLVALTVGVARAARTCRPGEIGNDDRTRWHPPRPRCRETVVGLRHDPRPAVDRADPIGGGGCFWS